MFRGSLVELVSGGWPMRLEDELRLYGCDISAQDFESRLADLLAAMYPNMNTEQLLYYPDQAKQYCEAVRSSVKCPGLPDEMILRRLQNIRKRGPG